MDQELANKLQKRLDDYYNLQDDVDNIANWLKGLNQLVEMTKGIKSIPVREYLTEELTVAYTNILENAICMLNEEIEKI